MARRKDHNVTGKRGDSIPVLGLSSNVEEEVLLAAGAPREGRGVLVLVDSPSVRLSLKMENERMRRFAQ